MPDKKLFYESIKPAMRVPDVAAGAFTAGIGLFPTDVAVQADGDFRKRLDASRQETG